MDRRSPDREDLGEAEQASHSSTSRSSIAARSPCTGSFGEGISSSCSTARHSTSARPCPDELVSASAGQEL
jgi:hypothetical protein